MYVCMYVCRFPHQMSLPRRRSKKHPRNSASSCSDCETRKLEVSRKTGYWFSYSKRLSSLLPWMMVELNPGVTMTRWKWMWVTWQSMIVVVVVVVIQEIVGTRSWDCLLWKWSRSAATEAQYRLPYRYASICMYVCMYVCIMCNTFSVCMYVCMLGRYVCSIKCTYYINVYSYTYAFIHSCIHSYLHPPLIKVYILTYILTYSIQNSRSWTL